LNSIAYELSIIKSADQSQFVQIYSNNSAVHRVKGGTKSCLRAREGIALPKSAKQLTFLVCLPLVNAAQTY
jgi:hypothetical protein